MGISFGDIGKALDYAPGIGSIYRTANDIYHGNTSIGQLAGDITGYNSLKGALGTTKELADKAMNKLAPPANTGELTNQQSALAAFGSDAARERAGISNQIERGGAYIPPGYGPASTPPAMAPPPPHPGDAAQMTTGAATTGGAPRTAGTGGAIPGGIGTPGTGGGGGGGPTPGGGLPQRPNTIPGAVAPVQRNPDRVRGTPGPGPVGNVQPAEGVQQFSGQATGAVRPADNGPPGMGPGGSGAASGPDFIDAARRLQFQNLGGLQDAAAGRVPSAAEIQGQNMANRGAAQQFGLASALQGGRSAGSVLRRAQMGSADVAARAREDAGALRAQEQATARGQLTNALAGVRGNEQDLGTSQAQLNQQDRHDLLVAQLQSMGYSVDAAKAVADAQAKDQASKMSFYGDIVGAAPGVVKALSDVREKVDIAPAHLDTLADALEGFTFRYKDPRVPGASPGKRVGIMAQDALRGGPAGRAMVEKGSDGRLRLDVGNALGAALAMSAAALRRARRAA